MTYEVLELFKKQTRSLYETAFFAYLLILSKGWSLVLSTMGRKEFNYLVILIILVYIFDSASNIIGSDMKQVTFVLYLAVLLHALVYGVNTIKILYTQMEVIRDTGMFLLLPVVLKKKTLFICFLALMMTYFAGEFMIHLYAGSAISKLHMSYVKSVGL